MITAFIDVLGFSSFIEDFDEVDAREKLEKYYEFLFDYTESRGQIFLDCIMFSDSFITRFIDLETAIMACRNLYGAIFRRIKEDIRDDFSERNVRRPFFVRGAIAPGGIYVERDRKDRERFKRNFVVSKALSRAYRGESIGKGMRLFYVVDANESMDNRMDNMQDYMLGAPIIDQIAACEISWFDYTDSLTEDQENYQLLIQLVNFYAEINPEVCLHYIEMLNSFIKSMERKYSKDTITLNKLIINCLDLGTQGPTESIQEYFVPVWINTLNALLKLSEQNDNMFTAIALEETKTKIIEVFFRKEGALFLEELKRSKQFEGITGVLLKPWWDKGNQCVFHLD